MSVRYYDTERSTEEIVSAIVAIDDVIAPSNNGKILCVENGKIKAKSASSFDVETVLESLDVSANGDYVPESGVDGFDEVHVAVPNTYAAGDEGKVVSNGALVAQTARATEITQNGTVDTTLNNSVTVNVSGGGSPTLQSKTVTPIASQQTVQPDSGYDGLSSVVVEGDADLVAGNIKKDISIFGVTGSYEGGGSGLLQLKIIDHEIAQHYNAVANKYTQEYLQTGLPAMAFKSYTSISSIFPRIANSLFDGVTTPSFYKPSGALTGVIFLQKVDKAYNKLYIKAKSAIKESGSASSIILAIGDANMSFNPDGWLVDAEKSVTLASSAYTAEQIMAQENLSIVSSDPALLSEQTIVYSIPNAASDYFIGLTVWNQEIYISDMYLTVE